MIRMYPLSVWIRIRRGQSFGWQLLPVQLLHRPEIGSQSDDWPIPPVHSPIVRVGQIQPHNIVSIFYVSYFGNRSKVTSRPFIQCSLHRMLTRYNVKDCWQNGGIANIGSLLNLTIKTQGQAMANINYRRSNERIKLFRDFYFRISSMPLIV